jgi:peptide/histidine transporter 3/4
VAAGAPLSSSSVTLQILAVVFFEGIGFYGVEGNLIMYLTGPLGMSTAAAAAGVNAWSGTVLVLPLVGALAADSRLGRYGAVMAASVLYLLSLGMLTASSALQTSQPHRRRRRLLLGWPSSTPRCTCWLWGYASRSSYFNWFHFFASWGYAIAAAGISYVEDNVGWTVGYGACWAAMVLCLAVFLLGTRTYRAEEPADGRALADAARAWAASMFRRKDTIGTERLLARDVEEGVGLTGVKLLPIWLTSAVFALVISQVTTLFTKQGARWTGASSPPATSCRPPRSSRSSAPPS